MVTRKQESFDALYTHYLETEQPSSEGETTLQIPYLHISIAQPHLYMKQPDYGKGLHREHS